jgi:hypothetical protein
MTEFTASVTEISIYPIGEGLSSSESCSVVLMGSDVRLLSNEQGFINPQAWPLIRQAIDNLIGIGEEIRLGRSL